MAYVITVIVIDSIAVIADFTVICIGDAVATKRSGARGDAAGAITDLAGGFSVGADFCAGVAIVTGFAFFNEAIATCGQVFFTRRFCGAFGLLRRLLGSFWKFTTSVHHE